MALETGNWVSDLVPANPPDTDPRSQGAAHLRLIKAVLQNTFPLIGEGLGFGVAGGTADAMTLTLTPDPGAAVAQPTALIVKAPNSTNSVKNPTITIGARGAITITKDGGNVLAPSDIQANAFLQLVYNSTSSTYDLLNPTTTTPLPATISGNTTLTAATFFGISNITAAAAINMPASATLGIGARMRLKSSTLGAVTLVMSGADTLDGFNGTLRIPSYDTWEILYLGAGAFALITKGEYAVGDVKYSSSPNTPIGFINAASGPFSRTTYGNLFAEVGTTFGSGDGSTTFGELYKGRLAVAAGAAPTFVENVPTQTPAANQLVVASNQRRYTNCMQVAVTNSSVTGLANGTYYVRRVDATHLQFFNTLALAQANSTPLTLGGVNVTCTLTFTGTSWALGEVAGEDAHMITTDTELPTHNHPGSTVPIGPNVNGATAVNGQATSVTGNYAITVAAQGGTAAMNIMPPSVGMNCFIKT